ncbi:MAG: hypothetical protein CFH34_00864 [Alphaproteobacteria bacterium MarineAlpha9_Bin4]|nr:ribosomal-protein-alanine N-acetyltransferase [Pelagibacterales bacterium]PPR26603.1 MAG: hypothetical protein CFH34_00864 [Alphaproteobacteria bacterium MarineAlpha9_Bin4]|tara:strand:- start:364 stop:795 length:432 start_codon:yes stop_codon:yes gene_type:complete
MQKNNINKIYKKYLSVSEDNCKKWSKDFFTNFFCNKNVFFFSSKIESGGYLIARKIFDEFEVLSLATNRKERRKGIASELLRSLFKKAEQEKAKKILLEVSKKNIPAIKMYEKFGFNIEGNRKNYYKTPSGLKDAYIMIKSIS